MAAMTTPHAVFLIHGSVNVKKIRLLISKAYMIALIFHNYHLQLISLNCTQCYFYYHGYH